MCHNLPSGLRCATLAEVVTGELTIGGRVRSFAMRLPCGADGQIPLVLVLHGNSPGFGGSIMREWTTFDKQADTWSFAVAYPDGWGGVLGGRPRRHDGRRGGSG